MNLIEKIENKEIIELLGKANNINLKNHGNKITLERAIFISWWCDKGDCAFCYMTSQKSKIKDSNNAKRHINSILAETELLKRIGWNIEFLSGGYGSFTNREIMDMSKKIYDITNKPVWLNIGIVNDLDDYGEEVTGITGAVETINPILHDKICPSKSLDDIREMLGIAGDLGFKKAITIILGLGETPSDLNYLFDFIEDLKIDRVIFYSLNPHSGTLYENSSQPASMYYAGVVAATRIMFPELEIITGTWIDNLANIGPLLLAGANGITKFPLFKMFGTSQGKRVEEEVKWAGKELIGTFTDLDKLKTGETLTVGVESFVEKYINKCLKGKI